MIRVEGQSGGPTDRADLLKHIAKNHADVGHPVSIRTAMTIIETIETMGTALTVDALSKLINVSPKTLYKATKSGRLPCYRIGGSIRLDPSEVVAWLRNRSTKS